MARKGESLLLCSLLAASAGIGQVWARSHLDSLPPSVKWYLEQRAEKNRFPQHRDEPESLNMRMVGKWGRGPASWLTGRDSLVFLSMGSEVAVFSAPDKDHLRVLSEIQCHAMTGRLCLKDSLLFIGCNGPAEVWNVADPAHPVFVNREASAAGGAVSVVDTLAYVLGVDSLKIFNVANPRDFRLIGACRDSGYNMCVAEEFVYICDRFGLYVIDARDPAHPHRATTLTGAQTGAVTVDSGYCYYATLSASPAALVIADVSDPYHPVEVGRRANIGGYDIYKLGMFVYLPGYWIVDVSNPRDPTIISSLTPGGNGVWTRSPFTSSFIGLTTEGLGVIDISDPVHPHFDTAFGGAEVSQDVAVSGAFAFVANGEAGMKVLDVSDVTAPSQVGSYDTAGRAPAAYCVAGRDSFVFLGTQWWGPTGFKVFSVADPSNPVLAATCPVVDLCRATVVRESLAFVAEDYHFEIFSIANPRNPRLVGSCQLGDNAGGLFVKDTLAYVCNTGGVQVVSIAAPSHPWLVISHYQLLYSMGICIVDSIAYLANTYDSLCIWSFADPLSPVHLGSVPVYGAGVDVVVVGGLAYVGCKRMEVIDVSNPAAPRTIGYYPTPSWVRRVRHSAPYVYAACNEGGVCIFETTSTSGVVEEQPTVMHAVDRRLWVVAAPSLIRDQIELLVSPSETKSIEVRLTDVSGRKIVETRLPVAAGKAHLVLPGDKVPPGVYFVTARSGVSRATIKIVRQ